MEKYFSMSPAELAELPVSIATGSPKPLARSAGIVSVITEEQIKSMGATQLIEVMETLPGIHVGLDAGSQDPIYQVRGMVNPNNSQMLMLLNGTRISTPFHGSIDFGANVPLAAVERIEVIRGPGSAVYGADAFAGVINIITKKATDFEGAEVGFRAGNWNSQSAWGQYGKKWQNWNFAANIQYQGTDGDPGRIIKADYQTINDINSHTNASHAPGSMNTLFKSINTHLNLQNNNWNIGFWANNILDSGSRAGIAGSLDPEGTANGGQYLADVRYTTGNTFDNWELQAHLSYLNSVFDGNIHLFPDNAIIPITDAGNFDNKPTKDSHRVNFVDGAIDQIGYTQRIPNFELTSLFKGFDDHLLRLSTGFRYEEIVVDENHRNYGAGVINGNIPFQFVTGILQNVKGTPFSFLKNTNRSIWSFVLQDEWQIKNDLSLTSGVRLDQYSDFGTTVNPRLALIWDINANLTGKLIYGRAFRAPSFFEQSVQNNPVLTRNSSLKPETINTSEISFDYRPTSDLRTALNFYYYSIDDAITTLQLQGGSNVQQQDIFKFQYQNSGGQQGYGTEFEWHWHLTDQWGFSGNYSWQRTQANQPVLGTPEHQIYAALDWRFMPKWQLQAQLNWIGNRLKGSDNAYRPLSDYESVDFTLRSNKLFGHVNLAASLRNAFDSQQYELSRLVNYPSNYPLPGRSFYFEASIDF